MSRPTIQTTLLGRLGNQLFTYSATRVMGLSGFMLRTDLGVSIYLMMCYSRKIRVLTFVRR